MEQFHRTLSEIQNQLKPKYIKQFEVEATKHVSGITFGAKEEYLLDARDQGLVLYHHGPGTRVIPGIPSARKEPTDKEEVFIEYVQGPQTYHLVGSVDADKQFKLIRIDKSQGKNYSRVSIFTHKDIIQSVTDILQQIESPQTT